MSQSRDIFTSLNFCPLQIALLNQGACIRFLNQGGWKILIATPNVFELRSIKRSSGKNLKKKKKFKTRLHPWSIAAFRKRDYRPGVELRFCRTRLKLLSWSCVSIKTQLKFYPGAAFCRNAAQKRSLNWRF